ncbi:cytochrome C [Bacillus sp. Bva_UNVM-123]|uniref:c-type cytochrome n=1 Tax=Bacillus sp. Bva_UNVM-123 TaxID=2829798 RepID=UPI00391F76BD
MKNSVIIFIITAVIGLGLGYLVYDVILPSDSDKSEVAVNNEKESDSSEVAAKPEDTTAVAEDNIFQTKGCLGCHAVSKLNLQGGVTGPDLSDAYKNVEGKHGKPLDEFLKEPTSAVMSSVIGGNPLTDEEIQQIVDSLK